MPYIGLLFFLIMFFPALFSSSLVQMWRTMYECHQVQNHITQQMNHLNNQSSTEPTTDYHRQATAQFEAEVTSWYNTFCNLLTSQREFVRVLNQWVRLTYFLPNNSPINSASEICALCEEWQLAVERLPDKVRDSFSLYFRKTLLWIFAKRGSRIEFGRPLPGWPTVNMPRPKI